MSTKLGQVRKGDRITVWQRMQNVLADVAVVNNSYLNEKGDWQVEVQYSKEDMENRPSFLGDMGDAMFDEDTQKWYVMEVF